MGLISLLQNHPATFFLLVIPLLYSVILHEMAHGLVAWAYGDTTAKRAGRLTLNPLPHIDPLGAIMLLFVGFGWAKPVPVNYGHLKNSKLAVIVVSLAGCFTNIAIATFFIFLLRFPVVQSQETLATIAVVAARINIALGAFNLLPIPPLDGSRVVTVFLPPRIQMLSARYERFGFVLLIALLYFGLLTPAIRFVEGIIYRGMGWFF